MAKLASNPFEISFHSAKLTLLQFVIDHVCETKTRSVAAENVLVEMQNGTKNLPQGVQTTTGNYHMPHNIDTSQNMPQHHPHGSSPGPFHLPVPLISIPEQNNFQEQADTGQNVAGNVLKKVSRKRKKQGLVARPLEVITADDNVRRDAGNVARRMRMVIELSPNLNGSKFEVEIKKKISINTLRQLLVDNGKVPADVRRLFSHNKLKVLKAMGRSPSWHGVKDGDVLYVFRAQDNQLELF